ncbi:MAG: OmpH family outer membrane protein [bacterium]
MKNTLKMSICAAALLLATAVSGWCAGEKFGVIDFERVLKEYYKTKPAEVVIEKQKADFKVEIERRLKTLEQMGQDYETARDAARNKALNEDAMKGKLADAEKKLMELKEYQQDVKKYSDDEKKRIIQESLRMRRRFSEDIQEVVRKHAVDKGLLMVVDSSSSIEDLRGSVIYRDDSVDITSATIRTLNEGKNGDAGNAEKPGLKK